MAGFSFPPEIPFGFQDVRQEFERLLDKVWHAGLTTAPLDGQDWAPCMDVVETNAGYQIRLEVPGMTAESVDVSVMENVLTIKGSRPKPIKPEETARTLRSECRYGSFLRRFEFALPVREDGISASCKQGVLQISVPKSKEAQGRRVVVEGQD